MQGEQRFLHRVLIETTSSHIRGLLALEGSVTSHTGLSLEFYKMPGLGPTVFAR